MNVPRLVSGLREAYDPYIAEIIIVNDPGEDATAAVTRRLASEDPRVRLIERRPPGGVGRALKDGYAAAKGEYILSMDCDFQLIIPELRDLFDVVADGPRRGDRKPFLTRLGSDQLPVRQDHRQSSLSPAVAGSPAATGSATSPTT